MSKVSELVKGFRANLKNGIPTMLKYDGAEIILTASPNCNGVVDMAYRPSKLDGCTASSGLDCCRECGEYQPHDIPFIPRCYKKLFVTIDQ